MKMGRREFVEMIGASCYFSVGSTCEPPRFAG